MRAAALLDQRPNALEIAGAASMVGGVLIVLRSGRTSGPSAVHAMSEALEADRPTATGVELKSYTPTRH
ncbi:MAG: hypothetical protein R2710_12975 [Acidimicrobiales bacterium]